MSLPTGNDHRLETGIQQLDERLNGGFEPGSLVVVAGPPMAPTAPVVRAMAITRPAKYVVKSSTREDVRDSIEHLITEEQNPTMDILYKTKDVEKPGQWDVDGPKNLVIDTADSIEQQMQSSAAIRRRNNERGGEDSGDNDDDKNEKKSRRDPHPHEKYRRIIKRIRQWANDGNISIVRCFENRYKFFGQFDAYERPNDHMRQILYDSADVVVTVARETDDENINDYMIIEKLPHNQNIRGDVPVLDLHVNEGSVSVTASEGLST